MAVPRLAPYRESVAGDLVKGVRQYERNSLLSEAFYLPLQTVEIVIRNAFNKQLVKKVGPEWFLVLTAQGLLQFEQCARLTSATDQLVREGKPLTSDRVTAALSFGFGQPSVQDPMNILFGRRVSTFLLNNGNSDVQPYMHDWTVFGFSEIESLTTSAF